jgi:hypothetical protein
VLGTPHSGTGATQEIWNRALLPFLLTRSKCAWSVLRALGGDFEKVSNDECGLRDQAWCKA